jgi:hypothetical protein
MKYNTVCWVELRPDFCIGVILVKEQKSKSLENDFEELEIF